jgi:hypothetical protein
MLRKRIRGGLKKKVKYLVCALMLLILGLGVLSNAVATTPWEHAHVCEGCSAHQLIQPLSALRLSGIMPLAFRSIQTPKLPGTPAIPTNPPAPTAPVCPHPSTSWAYHSSAQHKSVCSECGIDVSFQNHTGSYVYVDTSNDKFTCTVCNYQSTTAHTYGAGTPVSGNVNHTQTCSKCSHQKTSAHVYDSYAYNSSNHQRKCSACGFTESTATAHTLNKYTNYGSTHKRECLCGYGITENHNYSVTYNNNEHTKSCACGSAITEAHSLTLTYYNSSLHTFYCDCGYSGWQNHGSNFIVFNQSGHIVGCECNPGAGSGASHTYNSNNICTVCGYNNAPCSYGGAHSYTVVVEATQQGHRLGCQCNPYSHYIFGEHTFSGNTCTGCGYTK